MQIAPFEKISMSKLYVWFAFTALLLDTGRASASTVIVIITGTGIVLTADSKAAQEGVKLAPSHERAKAILVNDAWAVASVGVSRVGARIGSRNYMAYDLGRFFDVLRQNTPKMTVSPSQAATVVAKMSSNMISEIEKSGLITAGALDNLRKIQGDRLVTYIVAGYEGGQAQVRLVRYTIDWQKNI